MSETFAPLTVSVSRDTNGDLSVHCPDAQSPHEILALLGQAHTAMLHAADQHEYENSDQEELF